MKAIFVAGEELVDNLEEFELEELKDVCGTVELHNFKTMAEYDAFRLGIESAVGWLEGYVMVDVGDELCKKARMFQALRG